MRIQASTASTTSFSTVATASRAVRRSTVTTATGNNATGPGSLSTAASARWRSTRPRRPGLDPLRGFTLIEMLAVIALIAVGVTLTAVSLHGRSRGQLQAAAERVAAGLRDTRTRAMATGKPQWFTLDLRTHSFTAPGRDPRGLPRRATLDVTSAAQGSIQPGIARIGYFPDGSSSGGNITLSERHRSLRVDVDWLTGAVTIQREAGP
ncbi:MAG: type II secretion system protein GspH [Rhodanobacteraceae bacterium]|nr:MAG: type II secretion system protein GspH [Rhodanobacteraceae bacterium]